MTEEELAELVAKMNGKPGDLLLFAADKNKIVWNVLGAIRLQLGAELGLIDENKYNFLWVTEFPLFEWSDEENRYLAMHHPFTMPMEEDWDKVDEDQGSVRAKAYDIVRAKYAFCIVVELIYFGLTSAVALLRMTLLSEVAVYRNNVLMNANLVYLGFVLVILGLFNLIFVGGFFKTAYKFAKPFVMVIIAAFLVVGSGETLFHIPGLSVLNAFGFNHIGIQLVVFAAGVVAFVLMSAFSIRQSIKNFEKIDL